MNKQVKPIASKPRLGRGLSSLISSSIGAPDSAPQETLAATATEEIIPAGRYQPEAPVIATPMDVPILGKPLSILLDQITVNPYQPRREFKEDELLELTQSVSVQGVLQPILVAPADGIGVPTPYVLIAGERRLRACRQAGLNTIPAFVRPASRQQLLEWALIENIHRADLNPIEKGQAYRQYMDRFNFTQDEVAQKLGQPRSTVANFLRMLDLCDDVQKMLLGGLITFGHAKVLAGAAGLPDRQLSLARKVIEKNLTVRQLEELMARPASAEPAPAVGERKVKAAYLRDLEEQLTARVGTKVAILPGRAKNTGRIVVEYYSLEDFDRIAAGLGLAGDQS